MNVTLENSGGCRRIMKIDVPADTVKEDYETILKAYTKQAGIPGFRKGKAPAHIIEKRFLKDIEQDAKDRLVPKFYQEAIKNEGLNIAAVVDVSDVSFGRNDGLKFNVLLDLVPEFKLPKYKKVSLKREPMKISDSDVDNTVTRVREQFAAFEETDGRPVESGDLVQINYDGTIDGKPVADFASNYQDIGSGKEFWVPIGESEFLPGFNDGLLGKSTGDSCQIEVTFSEDYHVDSLCGKNAIYDVEVKAIKAKSLPDLDEKFLKHFDVDSEQALRDQLRTDMEKSAETKEKARLKDDLAEILISKTKIEPPESIVQQQAEDIAQNMLSLAFRQGAGKDQLLERRNEIMKNAIEAATKRVKLSYLTNRIGDEENIQVSEEEIQQNLQDMARQYGFTGDQLKSHSS